MANRLIALGVRNGDSFYLEREGRSALVDGGENQRDLCRLFKGFTGARHVDYLVCTHADADHINGLIGYLKDKSLRCSELWLPSYIGYRIEDILERPEESLAEITKELRKRLSDFLKEKDALDILEFNAAVIFKSPRSGDSEKATRTNRTEEALRDQGNSMQEALITSLRKSDYLHFNQSRIQSSVRKLREENYSSYVWEQYRDWLAIRSIAMSYVDLFKKMRGLIVAALKRKVRIRFFEFSKYSSHGGEPGFLEPANSLEILTLSALKKLGAGLSLLQILALSIQNEQSLVFISPQNECLPAVLFCADSDLKFYQPIHWSSGMVSTAPHHGSVSNDHAYWRFVVESGGLTIIWLRTHHGSVNQLADFLISASGQHVESTYCTGCQRISIELIPHNGQWKVVRKTSVLYE